MRKWELFIEEFLEQAKIFVFLVVIQSAFRIFMIVWFNTKISEGTSLFDIILTLSHGFRFDSKIASLAMIIPFLGNCILSPFNFSYPRDNIRKIFTGITVPLVLLSMAATVPYFREYDSQFNFFMFEIIYDDQIAVLKTVAQEYGLIFIVFLIALLSYVSFRVIAFFARREIPIIQKTLLGINKLPYQVLVTLLIMIITLGAVRGSFRDRPAMRKWSDITSDEFLNKMVMNPLTHLNYAYKDFKRINSGSLGYEQYLGKTPVEEAARSYFGLPFPESDTELMSSYLGKTVKMGVDKGPDHIFLIVMESYDIWPILPEFSALGIAEGLKELGEKGILYSRFVPSGKSTMASLSSILTGVPYMGRNISRISSTGPPYTTSISSIFEPLGYSTRLFYGGFSSWQNIGNMFKGQGFDEIYSSPSMEKEESDGVWGVQDDVLFDFVQKNIPTGKRTFDLILTTTYHPPFNVDVRKKGFTLDEIPPEIQPHFDGSMDLNQLGHIWYMDNELKEFVYKTEKMFPNSLFIITGDHYGRRFLNARPSDYIKSAVPLVLYGPEFIPSSLSWDKTPGSHIDIIPTILELTAPTGYKYNSFGEPLTASQKTTGIGYKTVIDSSSVKRIKVDQTSERYDQLMGLAWWYIFNGDSLTDVN